MAIRAHLYDAEGNDREINFQRESPDALDETRLLWLDVSGGDEGELSRVFERYSLPADINPAALLEDQRPRMEIHGSAIRLRVNVVRDEEDRIESSPLDFILIPNLVVTAHPAPVGFLESFNRRIRGDSELGRLEAPELLASLLDWHVTSFFRLEEDISDQIDKLDVRVLRARGRGDILTELVRLRRKVGRIRRILAPHREAYTALSNPDVPMISGSDATQTFHALYDRLERAIEAVENARELLLGSFEIHIAMVAQKTNDTMKVLTLATVALLPIGALAGIMGMNFKAGIFNTDDVGFWITVAVMVAISLGTVLYARFRGLI